ncbi:MAG TPA: DUF349 domain-containing protein [Bacteroidia bacterium]|nr:DUF349 domain-containing protein [Bacteroidia bacterium]
MSMLTVSMKEELIAKLEDLTKENVSEETFSRADEIKNDYLRECDRLHQEQQQGFIADGGEPDAFEPPKDPLDHRFSELMHILSDRQSKFRKMKADEVDSKYKEKEAVIAELEKLIAEETNIGKAFQSFKELQNRWNEIGNVPTREYKNLQSVYHRHVHNFYYNMKLSKDLRELDFKRNHEHRVQLLSKIESLLPMDSIKGIERMINLYRMEWSELGPTAPETVEPLRNRYRELIGQVYQKIRDFYQERQKEEHSNIEAKKILLTRAQGIAEENFDTPKQWQTMTDTFNGIFDEWKKLGYGPKKENEQVWNEFRAALNKFYGKKREFFGDLKKTHKTNKDKKLAIIEKAESIAAAVHDSWDDVTKEVLQLQKDWKEAGHIEQWEENKLWKKFREACDKFFTGKREHFSSRDAEQSVNLAKKEELIKRIEDFSPSGKSDEDLKQLRDFSSEWKSIEHVPIRDKQRIWERYKKALDSKYDAMKLESSNLHLEKFRSNVELLSQSDEAGNLLRKEKNSIKEKINKLQATISQYENNLGFFRNSKNMGSLLQEVEQNLSRAKEEIEMLKKKLKLFSDAK